MLDEASILSVFTGSAGCRFLWGSVSRQENGYRCFHAMRYTLWGTPILSPDSLSRLLIPGGFQSAGRRTDALITSMLSRSLRCLMRHQFYRGSQAQQFFLQRGGLKLCLSSHAKTAHHRLLKCQPVQAHPAHVTHTAQILIIGQAHPLRPPGLSYNASRPAYGNPA